jgi:DNA-binding transcriptional LysR family regulator
MNRHSERPVDLYQLDVFMTVAATRSMSAAAGVLGISQPAVSQALAQLEQALGLTLIDRSRRPLVLTSGGLYVSQNAEPLIGLARQLKAQALEASQSEGAYLRIGMIDSVANTIGPALIKQLVARTRGLSVQIGMATAQEQALLGREVDLIISTHAFVDSPEFEHRLLYRENFVAIVGNGASAAHEDAAAPTRVDLRALAQTQPFIRYSRTSTLGIRVERILRYNDLNPPRKLEVDHADTLTLLVAQGLGWAITTPTCLLQTGPRFAGSIELVPIEKGNSMRSIYLVSRRGEFAELCRALVDDARYALMALLDSHPALRRYVPDGSLDFAQEPRAEN